MKYYIALILLLIPYGGRADLSLTSQKGKILFLIQQGDHSQAIDLYQNYCKAEGKHDFELLHQMGLGILRHGFQQSDPEVQLLSLFGASVAAHEEVYYILEESLKSPYPIIQLIALHALARFQSDQALLKALSSDELVIRLEAAYQLCLKRHPQAVSHTESLMYKTPKQFHVIYPTLYAAIGNTRATTLLRRLLSHESEKVRTAAILSIAKHKRDDLLPQIRSLISHAHYQQQEAVAYTLAILKDEKALPQLQRLTRSSYPYVVLAAQQALYRLGQLEMASAIAETAKKGDLFAIALLSEIPEKKDVLIELLQRSDKQVRLNAVLALLEQGYMVPLGRIKELLIRNKQEVTFAQISTPGQTLTAWKMAPSELLQEKSFAHAASLELKEETLARVQELSEKDFLELVHLILATQQNDLVPLTVELLEELDTPEAVAILKSYQQKLGAPFIRNYCNLALYRLKEEGPYGELLRQWVKSQCSKELIQFKEIPITFFSYGEKHYELTPQETSRLLIEAFEAFTANQDEIGISSLLESIQSGHQKNRYALAGLLLRATE